MNLTIGISPCPNDTFLFDALLHQQIDTEGLTFNYVLEDVEQLNLRALNGELDVTKLSYGVLPYVSGRYALLESGSALGKGVGPLLVTGQPEKFYHSQSLQDQLTDKKIVVPGKYTTANLLLSLFAPKAIDKHEKIFSEISKVLQRNEFDAGLMIHEGRFTYQSQGLSLLLDLGSWWEMQTETALPLGGIAMKRIWDTSVYDKLHRAMKRSLDAAWDTYPKLSDFVKNNAQEMEEQVMRNHIELYVNDYTYSLGNVGRQSINALFSYAKKAGLLPEEVKSFFL